MRAQRLEILELAPALRKLAPFEGTANARLQRQLNRVPRKIECSIESLFLQENLRVEQTRPSDCAQIFR